ncbi:nitroreductase [Dactylosporangium vinaceum]|uniref:Acg family FMN-binding oxidoreductase n=1 Tax=Dactylosporangium vinaceum TaxID=53362 RepID=A0ABV5MA16_9ACTN|nr:nitroreductase [Dactylosporangium vinaceum]UAB93104.1 nitroreductase [Dactylosporangium vinaceum]
MDRDLRAELDLVAEASIAALRAPSILNSQPWRWRLNGEHAELWADRSRQLTGLDPDGRLLLLSCGAALNHAVVTLRAAGYSAAVERRPDPAQPDLVARFGRGESVPADTLAEAIGHRHTDRRPFGDERPAAPVLEELREVARRHAVHLQIVKDEQVTAFAAAVAHAGEIERDDPRFRADLRVWTNRAHGDGVTAQSVVAATRRTVAPRDFAIKAGLEAGPGSDRGTVYALFVTDGDEPRDWLAAGEALSEVWLALTARGLAASPISEVVEVPGVRHALRGLLGGVGQPAVAMRIGVPVRETQPPPTPRRSSSATLTV